MFRTNASLDPSHVVRDTSCTRTLGAQLDQVRISCAPLRHLRRWHGRNGEHEFAAVLHVEQTTAGVAQTERVTSAVTGSNAHRPLRFAPAERILCGQVLYNALLQLSARHEASDLTGRVVDSHHVR